MHLQRPVRSKRLLVLLLLMGLAIALLLPPRAHGATLVHWWKADGDAVDSVGTANGTLMGNTTFAPGHDGQAFSFDGNDDLVVVPDEASFQLAGSMTIEGWARTTDAVGPVMIASYYDCTNFCPNGSANSVYEIDIRGGQAFGDIRDVDAGGPDAGSDQQIRGGPPIADGAFHHVVLIRDNEASRLSLYVDGVVAAEQVLSPGSTGPFTSGDGEADPFTIGAGYEGGTLTPVYDLNGLVDDVKLWSGTAYPDSTPPSVAPVVTGPLGNDGWHTGDVKVDWVVTDPQSVVRSTSGCGTANVTTDAAAASFTCQAASVGGSTSKSVTVKRDATLPAVACPAAPSFPAGAAGRTLTATVTDGGSGPSAGSVTGTADTASAGARTLVLAGTDVAGNRTEAPCAYTVTAPAAAAAVTQPEPKLELLGVVALPSAKKCVSRRNFRVRFKAPAGVTIVSISVTITGRRAKVVKGKKLTAPVDLRGLPKGRFTVRITVVTATGQKIRGTRAYRTCAPKKGV